MESKTFQILVTARKNLVKLLDNLSNEQLNTIPKGFKNNVIWNAGHNLVTQQLLCYGLSNTPMLLESELIDKYRKATQPVGNISDEEILELKALLIQVLDTFEQDYNEGKFGDFKSYETSFGVTLNSIEDAIMFCSFHEAIHFGYILALKKVI